MKRLTLTKICVRYLLVSWLITSCICLCQGCSGTGFEKRTTLVPDSVGISIGEQRYDSSPAWWGVSVNAQWNLE